MTHKLMLNNSPFQAIAAGNKRIEMRLFDEKRALIQVGDEIEFENRDTHQTIHCTAEKLIRYQDFSALYAAFDKTKLGYRADERADPADMYRYYSPEQIKQYGVLAIQIKLK